MKAVVLKEFGGPENLSLDDLPIPRVQPCAVLIRAVAASSKRSPIMNTAKDPLLARLAAAAPALAARRGRELKHQMRTGGQFVRRK
jgi:NADPH:quinone reductase-like Zn-dependent oxidoreductase